MKIAALALSLALAASAAPVAGLAQTAPRFGTWGLDLAGRNPAIRPGDDFNGYANGRFLDKLQIPADRTGYGVNYLLTELSETQVHAILEESAKAEAAGAATPDQQRVGAFYRAFMDEARADALGVKPLQPDLDKVKGLTTRQAIAVAMGKANSGFGSAVFGAYIDADPKDPARYAVTLYQGGLGLPDRDYYLKPDFAAKKKAYQVYVAKLLSLGGWPNATANAAAIVAFETRIAQASWSRTEQRDPEKTYNPMSVAELAGFAPGFDWRGFLDAADLSSVDQLIVGEKSAFPKIAAIFASTPLPTLRAWMAYNLVDNAAPYLSKPFVEAKFQFRSKTLSGQPEQRARWKRAVNAVDGVMGEAVGRVYVERHFPPQAKAKINALVDDLRAAMKIRLEQLDWMSPATKAEAVRKLDQFTVKVGYPDVWRDYSALNVRADDLYGDVERGVAFEWARLVKRMHGPVDRSEWGMTPQTANAYYNPTMNDAPIAALAARTPGTTEAPGSRYPANPTTMPM